MKFDEAKEFLCDHQGGRRVANGVVFCEDCGEALQVWGGPDDGESLEIHVVEIEKDDSE